jgi:hypothetical protein
MIFVAGPTKEVDFLYHQGGNFTLGEAKYTSQPDCSHTSGITYVTNILGEEKIDSSMLFTRSEQKANITESVVACPVEKIFELFDRLQ